MKKLNIYRHIILVLFVFLAATIQGFAQNNSIKGKVTDETGSPLIGANVLIKGTAQGTVTDLNGGFVLKSIKQNKITMLVSFLGYEQLIVNNENQITHKK